VSSVLFALIYIGVGCVVVLAAWWLAPGRKKPKALDPEMTEVLVELHRIRRRFDVFLFRGEVDRRTKYAERQLSNELRRLRERERGGH
jgi:hypothetical protein